MSQAIESQSIEVTSPMDATVVEVLVEPGQTVSSEEELVLLESMKMQIPVTAPHGGTVDAVLVAAGDYVEEDQVLLKLRTED